MQLPTSFPQRARTARVRPSRLLALVAALACGAGASAQDETPPPPRPSGGAAPSDDAFRMGSPPRLQEGLTEEQMWPAATAEGWSKPCLVTWQRTFDDAIRAARASNRPILVAVNMDGEIASEHFAGVRYRDPETAALLGRYVCVIASVYRHTPRDYDEDGRRVECPRFGTVTCGEHVEAERELYETYFDGVRVSPRHIVLDLEGRETYDVYYSWDTASVITTFVKGVEGWPQPEPPIERALEDLAKSPDVVDRLQVEQAYRAGDREARRALLVRLAEEHVVDQVEVLRMAIFGLDLELARLARRALAECETEGALDLIAEALKAPLEAGEREMLLDAVERMGASSPRARTLLALHGGLSTGSKLIAPRAPRPEDLAREYEANARATADVLARAQAAESRPQDPAAQVDLAFALISRAEEAQGRFAELSLQDALAAAREARELGASGPRLDAALALASDGLGDRETARARAVAAVEGGLLLDGDGAAIGDLTPRARVRLLELFGDARRRAIRDAYRAGEGWPPEWLSDVNAAYASIADDPAVDARSLVDYHDFLLWIGATPRADRVLEDALERFPDSPVLHDRLRARMLWEGGPERLEEGYAERVERLAGGEGEAASQITWFAGYASLVAAEHHRRRAELDLALAAYERAEGFYRRNAELFPEGRDDVMHYVALGRAGKARVELERGDLEGATRDLLAALELRPESAASMDGLGLTPIQTAKMLMARLVEAGDAERAAAVQKALEGLDPRLLEPPASERPPERGRGPGERVRGG